MKKALIFPKGCNHERSGLYELHFSQKTVDFEIKNTIENCIMKALANI
jgi:hypothetical protein